MKILFCIILGLFLINKISSAQNTTDNDSTHHKIRWEKLRLYVDDDYLNAAGLSTDQYYTGGIQADVFYSRNVKKRPITDKLLISLPSSDDLYYYGVFRRLYTPIDLTSSQIQYGDRPYASVLTIQHGLFSVNTDAEEYISTELGLGAIGPITFGAQLQKSLHKLIHSPIPMGWGNQIHNDLILDYTLDYQKQLYKPSDNIVLLANVDADCGTLFDYMGAGFVLTVGQFGKFPFKDNLQGIGRSAGSKKPVIYFYMNPLVRTVMFNSTLEGGFFSTDNPYTIPKNDLNYVYLQYKMGIVFVYKKIGISASQHLRTAEFKTGNIQQVGNITISIAL